MTTIKPATPLPNVTQILLAQVRAATLYRKWVGSGPVDLDRMKAVIKHERRICEQGIIRCSRGLLREIRAEQKIVGGLINLRALLAKLGEDK